MPPNQPTVLHAFGEPYTWESERIKSTFTKAAAMFVKEADGYTQIWAASTDWFLEEWGRDTFIALQGILLTTQRYQEAQSVFRHFAGAMKHGLVPNRIQPGAVVYNTVDASLWMIVALQQYWSYTGDITFMVEMFPAVRSSIDAYRHGTSYERNGTHSIRMDTHGLITSPAQATWMDADLSGQGTANVTPRNGKAVEINALWYAALCFVEELCEMCHTADVLTWRHEIAQIRELVHANFGRRFWNTTEQCLFDVVDGDPHGAAIRCNQILAVSHGHDLLTDEQRRSVLDVVTRELLTPGGLRTLSPRDPQYRGYYNTHAPMYEKDQAYHQGTVWPWLMGPYCDALVRVRQEQRADLPAIQHELKTILTPLVRFCVESEVQSLPEVFCGDVPHEPGGTRSQAWSVAEVLSILSQYGCI
jgi:predicted glycogen debranching enzyme